MPLNLECQNKKKVCDPVYLSGCQWEGRGGFLCQACYRSGLLLQFNSVESSSGKVFKKFGSMKPVVREVCADSSNSNKLGFWNGF